MCIYIGPAIIPPFYPHLYNPDYSPSPLFELHLSSSRRKLIVPVRKQPRENKNMATTTVKDDQRKFADILDHASTTLRRKWRKIITGNETKRIRDHVREVPEYVKFGDKVAFTLGLCNILACEYFLVKQPQHFWIWYLAVLPILLVTRIAYFFQKRYHYFLIDFCYFVILCSFVNMFLLWESDRFFRVVYIFTHGPLTWAIVVWRNSLVFHDYDKITSVYIHYLPCLLYYCLRWHGSASISTTAFTGDVSTNTCYLASPKLPIDDSLTTTDFLCAAIGYVFWQVCYFAKTEIVDKRKLDSSPELVTSLRYLSADKNNAFAQLVVKLCRKLGIYRWDEYPDATSLKTKIVFISVQFLYTLLTFSPTMVMYRSHHWNIAYLIFIFTSAAFNGASFYIEVFSKVYQKKLMRLEEMKIVAEQAAQFSLDVASGRLPVTQTGLDNSDESAEKEKDGMGGVHVDVINGIDGSPYEDEGITPISDFDT